MAARTVGRFSNRMNESDATLWEIESDPRLRSTILAITLLNEAPEWSRLRDRVAAATEQIPRLRQKVEAAPLRLGPPRWITDEDFDLDYHLRRIVCPAPGDLRAVFDVAAPIYMEAFDKQRPLWECTLVEGLADGSAAFIQKVHHSFTDGVGGMKLADFVLDTTRSPRHSALPTTVSIPETSLAAEAIDNARRAVETTARLARRLPGVAVNASLHPTAFARDSIRTAGSIGKLVMPVGAPLSPVMTGRSTARRLDAFELPLTSLHKAARTVSGSVNDAFLAGVTGGMRRYHELHHAPVERLRVTMPINVRRSDDELGNNRFVPARFEIPVGEIDPSERMRHLGVLARGWRGEPSLPFVGIIAGALNRLPGPLTTAAMASMLKAIDFVATNVPGPKGARYLAGCKVVAEYAFAPPSGAAFAISLLSFDGTASVGLTIDTVAVPDPWMLTECMRQGFAEVLALA